MNLFVYIAAVLVLLALGIYAVEKKLAPAFQVDFPVWLLIEFLMVVAAIVAIAGRAGIG